MTTRNQTGTDESLYLCGSIDHHLVRMRGDKGGIGSWAVRERTYHNIHIKHRVSKVTQIENRKQFLLLQSSSILLLLLPVLPLSLYEFLPARPPSPLIGRRRCGRSGVAVLQIWCHLCALRCAGLVDELYPWCRAPTTGRPLSCDPAGVRWPAV